MTDMAEYIPAVLGTDATLAALVGSRIYPLVRPQNSALPAITYQRISAPRVTSHGGDSGLTNPRYQFNCWSDSYLEARSMAERLEKLFGGQSGMFPGAQASFVDNDLDDSEPDEREFRAIVDVVFWWGRTIA